MKNIMKKTLAVTALGLMAGYSYAATNPANPTTTSSTGDLTINATVNALYRISELTDITFPAYTGSGVWTAANEDFCVYTNNATPGAGRYRVTLTGSGGGGAFTITDGTNTMAYSVDYTDAAAANSTTAGGGTTNTLTTPGAAQTLGATTGLQGHSTSPTCAGAGNVNTRISVYITQAVAQAAPPGLYNGTLTFLIAAP